MTVVVAVPLAMILLAPSTGPLVPCWIAMLWSTPDMLGISTVTGPGSALALLVTYASWPVGLAGICSLPPFSTAGLPAPAACTALASSPVSLPDRAATWAT